MFCSNCGKQLSRGAAFCGSCGAKCQPLTQQQPVKAATGSRRSSKPKVIAVIVLVAVLISISVFLLNMGNGTVQNDMPSHELIGRWERWEGQRVTLWLEFFDNGIYLAGYNRTGWAEHAHWRSTRNELHVSHSSEFDWYESVYLNVSGEYLTMFGDVFRRSGYSHLDSLDNHPLIGNWIGEWDGMFVFWEFRSDGRAFTDRLFWEDTLWMTRDGELILMFYGDDDAYVFDFHIRGSELTIDTIDYFGFKTILNRS